MNRNKGLGVSMMFPLKKNLKIIEEQYMRNPSLTKSQVNMLSMFKWVGHTPKKNFPECKCLRCCGINLIENLEKNR